MRLSFIKIPLLVVVLGGVSFGAYQIFSIYRTARQTLADTRARIGEPKNVPFEKRILSPHLTDKIQILQNTSDVRDLVQYKNSYYAATSGGLIEISLDGKSERHFTVLDGLPESDLTCLAVWRDKLFIGTRTKNLVTFDGERFENYGWTDRAAQTVTSFLEANGKLLIGTLAGGLLEFDGENFTEFTAAENKKIPSITCLHKTGSSLYVGTFDSGLWVYESGVWSHFTTAEGLPSNRVVGIASHSENLYAATDLGLAVLQDKTFRSVAAVGPLSSLVFFDNKLFLTTDDGGIFTFDRSLKNLVGGGYLQNARLVNGAETLKLVSASGIFQLDGARVKSFVQNEEQAITDNFVSALAFDDAANLWVGTFRHGIDVFSNSGRKITHLETENLREINYLHAASGKIYAAASTGLISFDKSFQPTFTTKNEGLPAASVTHFSGPWTATAKGLVFTGNAGKPYVLTAVQGLPSNSIYTTLDTGEHLYAGTLGGLAVIEKNHVTRTFKDSNSGLKTNWVTALGQTDDLIFIGTYGGGIFELTPSGEIHSFESEIGKFVVNPNSFYIDGERLYAGTLTGAKVLNMPTQVWRTVKNVLPSEAVMAITGDDRYIYFGTTNGIARIDKSYFENGDA